MPSPFFLIGQAWKFYQKQPALVPVMIWLLFLPGLTADVLRQLLADSGQEVVWSSNRTILLILGMLVMWLVNLWGVSCVLVVGKRILQHKAGRTRTSFKAVRTQAARSLVPLLLTGMLRDCFTILWALALLVPGVFYALRTSFYQVVTVCEGKPYREALQQSKEVMHDRTGMTVLTLLSFNILLFLPVMLIDQLGSELIPAEDVIPSFALSVFVAGLRSIALLLSLLGLIVLYKHLTKGRHIHVTPDIDPED
jgi:uncharacterized membrane protein